jgi:hypothetical protein
VLPWDDVLPVRIERDGAEIAGMALSRALDPVAGGGDWVIHSADGGKTWDEPLYTGLRWGAPYSVATSSKLPLMTPDGLQVEVEARGESAQYLELTWSELRRDSDRDGLTDLVEERIATDPFAADTDGDGIRDAIDPMPQLAGAARADDTSQIVTALLHALHRGDPTRSFGANFLAGDAARLASTLTNGRFVVLSDDEQALYDAKFGETAFEAIPYVVIRHDGRQATLTHEARDGMAVFDLTKGAGGWSVGW